MKKFISLLLAALMFCSFCACGGPTEIPAPTDEEIISLITAYLQPQISEYSEELGLDDLSVDIEIKKLEIVTQAEKDSDGYISLNIRDRLVSPTLEKQLLSGEISEDMLMKVSELKFDYEKLYVESWIVNPSSSFIWPILLQEDGGEYTIHSEVIVKDGDEIYYIAEDAELAVDAEVGDSVSQVLSEAEATSGGSGSVSGKPYVGMSVSLIDNTSLGQHTKTAKNTVKYPDDPPAQKHDCTLYYWMEGSRCVFIARVQDDIGKVIDIDANPSGSYFGN